MIFADASPRFYAMLTMRDGAYAALRQQIR